MALPVVSLEQIFIVIMNSSVINISKIESYLHSIIDNVVSDNTYVGTPPETIKESWQDMCVIDLGAAINDMDAYGKGVVLVWLYARPLANGAKNVATYTLYLGSNHTDNFEVKRNYQYKNNITITGLTKTSLPGQYVGSNGTVNVYGFDARGCAQGLYVVKDSGAVLVGELLQCIEHPAVQLRTAILEGLVFRVCRRQGQHLPEPLLVQIFHHPRIIIIRPNFPAKFKLFIV